MAWEHSLFEWISKAVVGGVKHYLIQDGETGQTDPPAQELADDQEPDFPHAELAKLDEMINRPRWVVPVLPKGELEVLLDAAIALCKAGKLTTSSLG